MAYLVSGILYLSPGKILCNTGDGYVAFTISNDEKSALTKLRLRLGCVREQTWHSHDLITSGELYMYFHVSIDQGLVADCILPHQTFVQLAELGDVRQFLSGSFGKQSLQLLWPCSINLSVCDMQNFCLQSLKGSGLHTDWQPYLAVLPLWHSLNLWVESQ